MAAISKDSTWGGAIGMTKLDSDAGFILNPLVELSIFSDHFRTEIDSYDVETGRCDKFGEGKYDNRWAAGLAWILRFAWLMLTCNKQMHIDVLRDPL
jgi:hypothetical protein